MLVAVSLTFLWATLVLAQYDFAYNPVMPNYIKKALKEKMDYKPPPKHRTKTFKNITLQEVYDKIKVITRALNDNARQNGYKVDYKFRLTNSVIKNVKV